MFKKNINILREATVAFGYHNEIQVQVNVCAKCERITPRPKNVQFTKQKSCFVRSQ